MIVPQSQVFHYVPTALQSTSRFSISRSLKPDFRAMLVNLCDNIVVKLILFEYIVFACPNIALIWLLLNTLYCKRRYSHFIAHFECIMTVRTVIERCAVLLCSFVLLFTSNAILTKTKHTLIVIARSGWYDKNLAITMWPSSRWSAARNKNVHY